MKLSLDFSHAMRGVANDEILKPIIMAELSDPDFEGFDIHVEGWKEDVREYDGKFHPSVHSTWTARQLTYYLTHPEEFVIERPPLLFVLAVTAGKFWHKFTQRILLRNGILLQDEVPLLDSTFNRAGHTDGRLATGELLEIKTMTQYKIDKIDSAEVLREKEFGYWSQTQDYLDMCNGQRMRYLILEIGSPFRMQEFVVEADREYQMQQREKYLEAIRAARYGETPSQCCNFNSNLSKSCPARLACPVGTKNV